MKKKNVVLVFGITENFTFALANTLIGLIENNKKFWDDIVVYCDHISADNKKFINQITECIFIDAKEMGFEKKIDKEILKKYSIAAFYRYACFNLLNKYKTVIWNDVDILIQGDISGLLNYASNGIALTKNIGHFKVEANFNKLLPEYDMFKQLYNSGIIVFKDSLPNYNILEEWCINKTIELAECLRWPDQGILNILLQEFNIEPDLIDIDLYCCHPSLINKINSAKIIHAYGDEKFWNSSKLRIRFPKWTEYNIKWNNLVGNDGNLYPLVSCIMSTYNRYDTLNESVNSILSQTYSNFELIVVTEKCDNQEKICNILRKFKDNRIVIVKNDVKLGFSESLNKGISMAKGKYIARMDDDDISISTRFEKQVNFMETHPNVGICGTNARFFGKYNNEIGVEVDSELLKINTLFKTPFIHPTVMMRRELIDKYNLRYDKNYFTEDYELWSRAVSKVEFANLSEVLLLYRTTDTQMTSGKNEDKIHSSHLSIMNNQFKNYLQINPTMNELELIQGRIDVLNNSFNYIDAVKMKNNFIKEIINVNDKVKFYNSEKLAYVFNYTVAKKIGIKQKFKKNLKKIIVFFIKPFYSRVMGKVDNRIYTSEQNMKWYIDQKISSIEKDK